MWLFRRVHRVPPVVLGLASAWALLGPAAVAAGLLYTEGQPAWETVGLLWAGIALGAGLGAVVYNRTSGVDLLLQGSELKGVDVRSFLTASGFPALVGGSVVDGAMRLGGGMGLGWFWVPPAGAYLFGVVTVLLYNRAVVPFSFALRWTEEPGAGTVRITVLEVTRVRLVVSALTFGWVALGLAAVVVGTAVWLAVLHPKPLPPGFFGVGVAIFVGFMTAAAGFLASVLFGWWCARGAAILNRYGRVEFSVSSRHVTW